MEKNYIKYNLNIIFLKYTIIMKYNMKPYNLLNKYFSLNLPKWCWLVGVLCKWLLSKVAG